MTILASGGLGVGHRLGLARLGDDGPRLGAFRDAGAPEGAAPPPGE